MSDDDAEDDGPQVAERMRCQIRCGSMFAALLFFAAFYWGIFHPKLPGGALVPAAVTPTGVAPPAQQQRWRGPISNDTARAHARHIRADLRRAKKSALRGHKRAAADGAQSG